MRIWKVVDCRDKDLEAMLNTLSKSWEIFSVLGEGVTMTIVAYQEKKPKSKAQ